MTICIWTLFPMLLLIHRLIEGGGLVRGLVSGLVGRLVGGLVVGGCRLVGGLVVGRRGLVGRGMVLLVLGGALVRDLSVVAAVVVGVVLDVLGAAVGQHDAVLTLNVAAVARLLLGELGAVVRVVHGVVVGVPATRQYECLLVFYDNEVMRSKNSYREIMQTISEAVNHILACSELLCTV